MKDTDEYEIECPTCRGYGCGDCNRGHIDMKGCPQKLCKGIGPVLEMIDLFHEGIPPVGGGALDQSASFLEAARFLKNVEQRIENQR